MSAASRIPFDLPTQVKLFPLSGVFLLPFSHVPLTVFEPRYLNLVDDALAEGRVIALIQPRETVADPVPDDAPLYDIGTLGRIIQFADVGDGRYHITLEGLSRFSVQRELPSDPARGYRVAQVDYSNFEADLSSVEHDEGPGRDRIVELMEDYFTDKDIEADWDAVAAAPYEALVSSLAMTCPFAPGEKQALLQCASHEERATMLISLFEMSGDTVTDTTPVKH